MVYPAGMTGSTSSYARQQTRYQQAWTGFGIVMIVPLLVFAACVALRLGIISLSVALDLIALKIAWPLSWLGLIVALGTVWIARGAGKGGWLPAALAVLAAGLCFSVFGLHFQKASAVMSRPDVVTNASDPPVFRSAIMQTRRAARAPELDRWAQDPGVCPGATAVMTQVAPGVAGFGLQEAGFQITSLGVARADGVHRGFWFGRTWDAVIRIRPGRTDVRVVARDDRPSDEGEACRLATRIVENLQVRE